MTAISIASRRLKHFAVCAVSSWVRRWCRIHCREVLQMWHSIDSKFKTFAYYSAWVGIFAGVGGGMVKFFRRPGHSSFSWAFFVGPVAIESEVTGVIMYLGSSRAAWRRRPSPSSRFVNFHRCRASWQGRRGSSFLKWFTTSQRRAHQPKYLAPITF